MINSTPWTATSRPRSDGFWKRRELRRYQRRTNCCAMCMRATDVPSRPTRRWAWLYNAMTPVVRLGKVRMHRLLLALFTVVAVGVPPLRAAVAIDCGQSPLAPTVEPEDWVAACRAVAEQGNVAAQTNFGRLYQAGR